MMLSLLVWKPVYYNSIFMFHFTVANVNDRSMLGERDSEMAIVVQDYDMVIRDTYNIMWQPRVATLFRRIYLWTSVKGRPQTRGG
jgi:hypothetical protein